MPRVLDIKADTFDADLFLGPGGPQKRFKLVYNVLADNADQDEDVIRQTDGLPAMGDVLRGCYCVGIRPKETASLALLWEVETTWSSAINLELFDRQGISPEFWLPDWEWGAEQVDMVIEVDQETGEPIVNAANEPIILTGPWVIPILTITRYERVFDPDTILTFCNTTNSTPFWGAPTNCALMADIHDRGATANDATGNPIRLRQVTYTIKFNFTRNADRELIGWKAQPLNHGTRFIVNTVTSPEKTTYIYEQFTDKHGNPTTGNLAADGTALGEDEPPVYLDFHRYPKTNFNNLNLGPFG